MKNKKHSKVVLQLDKDGYCIAEYSSTIQAEKETGINSSNIISVCNGRKHFNTAGGYFWEYKNE